MGDRQMINTLNTLNVTVAVNDHHDEYQFEKSYWGDCTNTFDEDQKHYIYANFMQIPVNHYRFNVNNKSILDIGGGPSSMLLKCCDLKRGMVIDPIEYPHWTKERYASKNIQVNVDEGENNTETGWDEVWIYNCLQHVHDVNKLIQQAKKSAKVFQFPYRKAVAV